MGKEEESRALTSEFLNASLANFLFHDTFRRLEDDPRYPIFLEKLGFLEIWKAMPR